MDIDHSNLLLQHSRDMILMVNPETLAIEAGSLAACNYLEYSLDQLNGLPITDLDNDLTAIFFWEGLQQGTETGISNAQGYFLTREGNEKAVRKTVYLSDEGPEK